MSFLIVFSSLAVKLTYEWTLLLICVFIFVWWWLWVALAFVFFLFFPLEHFERDYLFDIGDFDFDDINFNELNCLSRSLSFRGGWDCFTLIHWDFLETGFLLFDFLSSIDRPSCFGSWAMLAGIRSSSV